MWQRRHVFWTEQDGTQYSTDTVVACRPGVQPASSGSEQPRLVACCVPPYTVSIAYPSHLCRSSNSAAHAEPARSPPIPGFSLVARSLLHPSPFPFASH
eukprot:2228884-Amphidinium_carterae.1